MSDVCESCGLLPASIYCDCVILLYLWTLERLKTGAPKKKGVSNPPMFLAFGVSDGTRTRDNWGHNPVLYQLSYTHHIQV